MVDFYDDIPGLFRAFDDIGVRAKHIAALTNVTETRLSRARTGAESLPGQDILDMRNLLRDLRELVRRNHLPPSWGDLRPVRRALEELRNKRRNPPSAPSDEDLELYTRFARGDDSDRLAFDHKTNNASILVRVEQVLKRVEYLSRKAATATEISNQ